MDERTKLLLALQQVENITELAKDNQYEKFFIQHLTPLYYEIKRQISLYNTNQSS